MCWVRRWSCTSLRSALCADGTALKRAGLGGSCTEHGPCAGQLLSSLPRNWKTHVHPVPAAPDMLQRPVQPVLVQVTAGQEEASPAAQPVTHGLDALPAWAPNQPQVKALRQVSLCTAHQNELGVLPSAAGRAAEPLQPPMHPLVLQWWPWRHALHTDCAEGGLPAGGH